MGMEQLVQKAKDGDDEAFLELMGSLKIDLYKTALAYLRNEEDALEAIQEVTFRAYKNLRNIKEPSYFKSWMIRIMINYCNDTLKWKKRMVMNEEFLLTLGKAENHSLMEIQDAMQALDERYQEVLTLKYFHDLKITDIAGALQCPEGTVKTWLNKALKSLREKLEEKGEISHV
ncbi:putative RNA polymerase [Bacillus sp. TS-2]|nr:putative RNA polymerase [Bacillus sp. TS-2]